MGEAVDQSFSQLAPQDIRAVVAYLRTRAANSIARSAGDTGAACAGFAPGWRHIRIRAARWCSKAPASVATAGAAKVAISPLATLTGAWAVNDPGATNVAQIVISGTRRHTPAGAISMPAFGDAYSDDEIAAVANYVTARFGSEGSKLTAQDVAELRKQTSQ